MIGYLSGVIAVDAESPESFRFQVSELEIVRLVCTRRGFKDVDVEPDPTGVKIRATNTSGGSVAVKGETLAEACRKMVKAIW